MPRVVGLYYIDNEFVDGVAAKLTYSLFVVMLASQPDNGHGAGATGGTTRLPTSGRKEFFGEVPVWDQRGEEGW